MTEETPNWPWIEIQDDKELEGVVWRLVGEIDMEDTPDGGGLISYDLEVATEDVDMKKLEDYTNKWIRRAIERGIESMESQ